MKKIIILLLLIAFTKAYAQEPVIPVAKKVVNFDDLDKIEFNALSRQRILQVLIQYFELHLSGFKTPKSVEVLKVVFS